MLQALNSRNVNISEAVNRQPSSFEWPQTAIRAHIKLEVVFYRNWVRFLNTGRGGSGGKSSLDFFLKMGHVERSFDLSVLGGVALLRSSQLPQALLFFSAKLMFLGFYNMY